MMMMGSKNKGFNNKNIFIARVFLDIEKGIIVILRAIFYQYKSCEFLACIYFHNFFWMQY